MKIKDIYKKYKIHPNLITHQLRVAKVASLILENWTGKKLDNKKIIRLCLVHDLGNLVRMKIDDDYWLKIKDETIKKYGKEDDVVTIEILEEVGTDVDFRNTILEKRFINSTKIMKSNNWELKILLYSDLRVTPANISSLKERLDEVIHRRPDLSSRPDISELLKSNFELEKQIQNNVSILLSDINDETVEVGDEELLNTEI